MDVGAITEPSKHRSKQESPVTSTHRPGSLGWRNIRACSLYPKVRAATRNRLMRSGPNVHVALKTRPCPTAGVIAGVFVRGSTRAASAWPRPGSSGRHRPIAPARLPVPERPVRAPTRGHRRTCEGLPGAAGFSGALSAHATASGCFRLGEHGFGRDRRRANAHGGALTIALARTAAAGAESGGATARPRCLERAPVPSRVISSPTMERMLYPCQRCLRTQGNEPWRSEATGRRPCRSRVPFGSPDSNPSWPIRFALSAPDWRAHRTTNREKTNEST
jgi:hypothetical protein